MNYSRILATASGGILIASAALSQSADMTEEDLMKQLDGVAPASVLDDATLMSITAEGEAQMVKEGSNGWTCMAPMGDAMCADAGAMDFVRAFAKQEDPPETLGFVYMLLGDNGASNTDPYAESETADNEWVVAGPHVMIVGPGAAPMLENYPHQPPEDAASPWVMWPDTPYAHLMIPVE